MIKDNLFIDAEARERLVNGIRKASQAVGSTMGTGGSNALIEAIENPGHLMTNDGATILSSIRFADPLEEMGRKILLEAVSRANKASGDGSSTTTVLTDGILSEGMDEKTDHVWWDFLHLLDEEQHVDYMEIKRSLEDCISYVEKSLEAQSKEITVDEVGKVASISAEDEQIGALIQEIYQQIGKDGIIHWDISKTTEDTYTIGNGITIEGAGYLSPYMCDIDEKTGQFTNVARWKNPHILITKQKVTSASEFNTLFASLNAKEIKEVVVFCDEIEATVIPDLIQTRAVRGFKTLVVKMPTLWKDQWYEDLAKASGATIIDQNAGITLKNMTMEHLGKFANIVVSKEDTFIDGIQDISAHLDALKDEATEESLHRVARLNTKTARLFIGAQSDSALSYKRLKIEDAISAGWQALHGGIVAGGGVALLAVTKELPDTIGGDILKRALEYPFKQIMQNAGFVGEVNAYTDGIHGVDTRTKYLVDMFEAGIVDPKNVVLNAVKNAISVASTALTITTIVTLPTQDETLR